ncbi:hypothetical protein OK016_08305 [Vibrio chagasii]|nr:hypothetical protein [Vibrio chagasii]
MTAQYNIAANKIDNVPDHPYVCGANLMQRRKATCSSKPLSATSKHRFEELTATLAFVDPPRSGMDVDTRWFKAT